MICLLLYTYVFGLFLRPHLPLLGFFFLYVVSSVSAFNGVLLLWLLLLLDLIVFPLDLLKLAKTFFT